jgi:predicted transcriptional regulator
LLPEAREIAARRRALGLTQAALAQAAGLSQSLVAKIEAGKVDAAYSRVKRVFDALEALEARGERRARDVMHRGVVGVKKGDKVAKAVALMRRRGISQLPVFDDGGRCVGSVSEKTILDALAGGRKSVSDLKKEGVEIALSEAFPLIDEDTPLSIVSGLLAHHAAVLVQRRGRVVGIITKSDLLK